MALTRRQKDVVEFIAKFVDHSPFYQQEQIAARSGVEIDRHKMGRGSAEVAEQMKPLYRALKAELIQGRYLQGDETHVDVLDPERPGAARKAWLWTYYGPENPTQAVVFEFHLSRGEDSPKKFLPADWQGVFQADGYIVYESIRKERPGIIPANCNAHMRRKWVEAIKGGGQSVLDILALRCAKELRSARTAWFARSAKAGWVRCFSASTR